SRPFYFRGCGLTAECLPAREMVRVRFPAAAPILHGLRHAAESPKLSLLRAARGNLPFSFGVVADKECACPASKPMWERYPPTPPFHCGKLDQCTERSLINFFRWV